MRLNVRCCCQPTKIFGTLEVPEAAIKRRLYMIATAEIAAAKYPSQITYIKHHCIQIKQFGSHWPLEEAITDNRPIEFWRKIPGFKEGDEV